MFVMMLLTLPGCADHSSEDPILILIERNPWLMVIGSDTPTFVLYNSNRAIWKASGDNDSGFMTDVLTDKERQELESMAAELIGLDEFISVSEWTDQPAQEIYFLTSDRMILRTVYGSLRPSLDPSGQSGVRQKAPDSFLRLFDALVDFSGNNAEPWTPDNLEVMIWPYEYAPDDSIEWPADWPDISSPTTRRRGDSASLYVPYSNRSKLIEFLKSRKPRGAVQINEHKWAVAVRTPLPHEVEFGPN